MKKLVRDNIPNIIRSSGQVPVIRTLDDSEYLIALKNKMIEEAQEFREASEPEKLFAELADLQELIMAACEQIGYSLDELEAQRIKKASTNGQFEKRIFLEKIDRGLQS